MSRDRRALLYLVIFLLLSSVLMSAIDHAHWYAEEAWAERPGEMYSRK